ncbi:MAG: hypothetical protein NTW01_03525 [Gammaproteobacteria bacterium]|nr:hypothetical protein [Gammaproteobacteria bacterium]
MATRMVKRDRDQVIADMRARLASYDVARTAARERAIPALRVIVSAIRRNPGTGQVQRLTAFLGGLYNGPRFPFDMTDLRALDTELADACIDVLNYDRYSQAEIHTWGVIDGDELNDFLVRDGHYYTAQQRRIGRELYESKFGERGHTDEGLKG